MRGGYSFPGLQSALPRQPHPHSWHSNTPWGSLSWNICPCPGLPETLSLIDIRLLGLLSAKPPFFYTIQYDAVTSMSCLPPRTNVKQSSPSLSTYQSSYIFLACVASPPQDISNIQSHPYDPPGHRQGLDAPKPRPESPHILKCPPMPESSLPGSSSFSPPCCHTRRLASVLPMFCPARLDPAGSL
jgi:hypothetical protein